VGACELRSTLLSRDVLICNLEVRQLDSGVPCVRRTSARLRQQRTSTRKRGTRGRGIGSSKLQMRFLPQTLRAYPVTRLDQNFRILLAFQKKNQEATAQQTNWPRLRFDQSPRLKVDHPRRTMRRGRCFWRSSRRSTKWSTQASRECRQC
jgi:phage-related protein